MVTASTRIPKPARFFFETYWLLDPLFLPTTLPSWTGMTGKRNVAVSLAARKKRFRSAAKVWKWSHRYISTFDNDCKFVVDLLDFWEELCWLSTDEGWLRCDARECLAASIKRQSAHWKQRKKCRAVREGDQNTGFFHTSASQHRRGNWIRALDVDEVEVLDHPGKAVALCAFYADLLGRRSRPAWRFDLAKLYRGVQDVDERDLVG